MNSVKQFWKSGILGKAVIGYYSLFVLCCLCSIPLVILAPTTPTPIPTEIVSHLIETEVGVTTEIIQPTATRIHTNTSVSTSTLGPTGSPRSTNTSEPVVTRTNVPSPTATLDLAARGASCVPDNPPQTGKVVDMVDGDTIKVLLDQDGQTYTIR